jgi:hypothetical protein
MKVRPRRGPQGAVPSARPRRRDPPRGQDLSVRERRVFFGRGAVDGVLLKDLREAQTEAGRGDAHNVNKILPRAIDAAEEVRRLLREAIDKGTQLEEGELRAVVIKAHNLI